MFLFIFRAREIIRRNCVSGIEVSCGACGRSVYFV
nr:MAG TPA: Recombinase zinc beta ribbon domain [Caudoviricetes sp.]